MIARCWMISANTAGPKKLMTSGSVCAMFSVSAVVGLGDDLRRDVRRRGPELALGESDALLGRGSMICEFRLLTRIDVASPASWS